MNRVQPDTSLPKKIKIYHALLTQSETNPPIVNELQNTLGGVVTWTRDSEGLYLATGTNLFGEGYNTSIIIGSGVNTSAALVAQWYSENIIQIITLTDNWLSSTAIKIEIFPIN